MELRRPQDDVYEIKPCTTFEDFKEYIRTVDEKRSSSPSGRHYGHYKTLLDNDERYLQIIHGILELALTHGIVLDRWKNTVTALIEKKTWDAIYPQVSCNTLCRGRLAIFIQVFLFL